MSVFKLAQYANEIINGGDESKFSATLIVISAIMAFEMRHKTSNRS